MSQRECPSCGIDVDTEEEICPVCQYEFPENPGINIKLIAFILLLLMIYPFVKTFC